MSTVPTRTRIRLCLPVVYRGAFMLMTPVSPKESLFLGVGQYIRRERADSAEVLK
jgi:hypothetical protein